MRSYLLVVSIGTLFAHLLVAADLSAEVFLLADLSAEVFLLADESAFTAINQLFKNNSRGYWIFLLGHACQF